MELERKMRDVESESHEGKRKSESVWPIFRIHHQRSRYIYDMYYKKQEISRELYDWCIKEGYADGNLIAKWKKGGYERLCCLRCIQTKEHTYGTTCICRVSRDRLEPGKVVECVHCGCRGCNTADVMSTLTLPALPSDAAAYPSTSAAGPATGAAAGHGQPHLGGAFPPYPYPYPPPGYGYPMPPHPGASAAGGPPPGYPYPPMPYPYPYPPPPAGAAPPPGWPYPFPPPPHPGMHAAPPSHAPAPAAGSAGPAQGQEEAATGGGQGGSKVQDEDEDEEKQGQTAHSTTAKE